MKSMCKPGDRFFPFFASRNLPDPSTATVDVMEIQSFEVKREPFFRCNDSKLLTRFVPQLLRFKRMRDEEGNWAWTFPLDLSKQRPGQN